MIDAFGQNVYLKAGNVILLMATKCQDQAMLPTQALSVYTTALTQYYSKHFNEKC